ncbi:DUF4347 domain-containing protein, partial [Psychromonas sp.]|uniref:DUF4347 domain-containing protein n=1 Tax=Psychromonas sp. TaxID=1884585 RepID=UPI003565759E
MKKEQNDQKNQSGHPYQLVLLEPRILFSADPLGVAPVLGELDFLSTSFDPIDNVELSDLSMDSDFQQQTFPTAITLDDSAVPQIEPEQFQNPGSTSAEQTVELVVIDSSIEDSQILIEQIQVTSSDSQLFILYLDNAKDALQQMTQAIAAHENISGVHLLTHATSEGIYLNSTLVTTDSLLSQAELFSAWGSSLTEDADILIYGCDFAQTEQGKSFIQQLAAITGADIAASDDKTGAAALGGDWDLEYQVGEINTTVTFEAQSVESEWQGLLATYVVNTTDDTIDINILDDLALDALGKTSLRAAIMQANASAEDDTILLGAGTYTLGLVGTGENASITGDLDVNSTIVIQGVDADNTIIDGGGLDRVFDLTSPNSNLTLNDLSVKGGLIYDDGGGINVADPDSTLTLNQVIVSDNQAVNGSGISNKGTMTLTDVEISNNTSTDSSSGKGGGLYNWTTATLTNVTVSDNSAGIGGGIYNEDNLTLTNVTVSGNTAAGAEGGGIY